MLDPSPSRSLFPGWAGLEGEDRGEQLRWARPGEGIPGLGMGEPVEPFVLLVAGEGPWGS